MQVYTPHISQPEKVFIFSEETELMDQVFDKSLEVGQ